MVARLENAMAEGLLLKLNLHTQLAQFAGEHDFVESF
jgi:hypothetical protein